MGLEGRGRVLECYDMVAGFDGCNALANGLDDASALMAEDDGKCAFRIFAGECVCICAFSVLSIVWAP